MQHTVQTNVTRYTTTNINRTRDQLDAIVRGVNAEHGDDAGAGVYWHWNDYDRAQFVCSVPGAAMRDLFKTLEDAGLVE